MATETKSGTAAAYPGGDAQAPRPGAAQPPLDLSQGHIGTRGSASERRAAISSREDCFAWISEGEFQAEVLAAFRGALMWAAKEDFDAEALESGGAGLHPGTLIGRESNEPWLDHSSCFDVLLDFIYWRLAAFAEERGLDLSSSAGPQLPLGVGSVRQRLDLHPWRSFVGAAAQRKDDAPAHAGLLAKRPTANQLPTAVSREFVNLTPGARAAKRGTVSCRPGQPDWPDHNLVAISDAIVRNPYIRGELGRNVDVSIQRSQDMSTFLFIVSEADE